MKNSGNPAMLAASRPGFGRLAATFRHPFLDLAPFGAV
jgi:hypothetical protein